MLLWLSTFLTGRSFLNWNAASLLHVYKALHSNFSVRNSKEVDEDVDAVLNKSRMEELLSVLGQTYAVYICLHGLQKKAYIHELKTNTALPAFVASNAFSEEKCNMYIHFCVSVCLIICILICLHCNLQCCVHVIMFAYVCLLLVNKILPQPSCKLTIISMSLAAVCFRFTHSYVTMYLGVLCI